MNRNEEEIQRIKNLLEYKKNKIHNKHINELPIRKEKK
jgi:hypothetical protein